MAYPNVNTRIPVQQVISYRASLALYPEDVGMVVGRQGRTINSIKNELGLIELRVMQPNQWSGNFPWVFIHGINAMQVQKAYMDVLTIAQESMRRRLTEIPMTAPAPVTIADSANFVTIKNGKKLASDLKTIEGNTE